MKVILDELQQCAISQQGHGELQACWQALANGQPESLQLWAQQVDAPVEGSALQQQWQLLQALRLLKGGSKPAQVASKLGYANEAALQAACQQWGVGEDGDAQFFLHGAGNGVDVIANEAHRTGGEDGDGLPGDCRWQPG